MNNILILESNKYAIKIENFEGPLDLLCHLIDKNKMNITDIKINEITDQYIEYINKMESMNLEVTSEFLVMASTLTYLKSKSLLPNKNESEEEITEDELIRRIVEYKKYKEIIKILKINFEENSKRFYKFEEQIEFPKQRIDKQYEKELIPNTYKQIIERNNQKVNLHAKNIEKIAVIDTYTVASKVKDIFRELVKNSKFVFSKLFSLNKCSKMEVITAFSGVLELTRRNKVIAEQEKLFGDIIIEKAKNKV